MRRAPQWFGKTSVGSGKRFKGGPKYGPTAGFVASTVNEGFQVDSVAHIQCANSFRSIELMASY